MRYCLFCGQPLRHYYYFCSDFCRRNYALYKLLEEQIEQMKQIEAATPKIHSLCASCQFDCKIKTAYPEGKIICQKYPEGIEYKEEAKGMDLKKEEKNENESS